MRSSPRRRGRLLWRVAGRRPRRRAAGAATCPSSASTMRITMQSSRPRSRPPPFSLPPPGRWPAPAQICVTDSWSRRSESDRIASCGFMSCRHSQRCCAAQVTPCSVSYHPEAVLSGALSLQQFFKLAPAAPTKRPQSASVTAFSGFLDRSVCFRSVNLFAGRSSTPCQTACRCSGSSRSCTGSTRSRCASHSRRGRPLKGRPTGRWGCPPPPTIAVSWDPAAATPCIEDCMPNLGCMQRSERK